MPYYYDGYIFVTQAERDTFKLFQTDDEKVNQYIIDAIHEAYHRGWNDCKKAVKNIEPPSRYIYNPAGMTLGELHMRESELQQELTEKGNLRSRDLTLLEAIRFELSCRQCPKNQCFRKKGR